MSEIQRAATADELAAAMRELAENHKTIRLGGNFSKDRLGSPLAAADAVISTSAMTRVLQYEPRDLTIRVEAGLPWTVLERILAEHRQMLPLDPAWRDQSTVGGVIAANLSGPRRRAYGTARDMVIGMTFATLEGKLIKTGGMVVKNVAGLDMAKMMIGSFGTLAAIVQVNFKVFPIPAASRTFVLQFDSCRDAFAKRNEILRGVLQPIAIDYVNPQAAAMIGLSGHNLLVQASGNAAVIDRWTREFANANALVRADEELLWESIREFTPRYLAANPLGEVRALPSKLAEMPNVIEHIDAPIVARAGSGVIYAHYHENAPAVEIGGGFEMMKKVKRMFDPGGLLNPGRLYGCL